MKPRSPPWVMEPSARAQASVKAPTASTATPIQVPRAPKTVAPRGSSQTRTLFLKSCQASAKSMVSWPTPRMESEVWPAARVRSSRLRVPDCRASMNWGAPLVPKTLEASSRAAAWSPEAMYPWISPTTRWKACWGASPSLARVTMPLDMAAIILLLLRPALSSSPARTAVSPKEKPRVFITGAFAPTVLARSFMPTPVAWETWKRWSMAPTTASPSMPKALKAAEVFVMSTSSPRIRPASRYWEATVSRVPPVRPMRVFRSATVVPTWENSAGTVCPTRLAVSTRPSSLSPVAPVPTRMVSVTSSKTSPTLYRAVPAATRPAPPAATPATMAVPKRLPTDLPAPSASCPAPLTRAGPKSLKEGRTGSQTAESA